MIIQLFLLFLKIGAFTFGGGYAMIPLISYEIVDKGYMAFEQIVDFISIAESTPGVFAINIATFVGDKTSGFLGAITSNIAIVLPSFIITIFICKHFNKVSENNIIKSTLAGLYPVVIVFLLKSIFDMSLIIFLQNMDNFDIIHLDNFINVNSALIFISLTVINIVKKLSPSYIIIISAILGVIFYGI